MIRVLPRARVVTLAAILVATGFSWNLAPRPLPAPGQPASAPLPFGLGPQPADAAYCTTPNPAFTGHLTQTLQDSGAPPITNRTTSGTVYGYIGNVDTTWACTLYRRYDGVAWVETLPDQGTFDWGTIINSTSVACNWAVGTTDYLHANASTTCPGTDTTNVLTLSLAKDGVEPSLIGVDMEAVFQPDTAHDTVDDFMFVHADCDTTGYYGAESIRWNATFGTSTSANRPGALCDVPTFDATGTAQQLIYDHTAPSGSLLVAGGATYTATTIVNLTPSATDTIAGLSQMRFSNDNATWSAWETYATSKAGWDLTAFGGNSSDGTHTVYVQYTDLNGNTSGSPSDTITLDLTPATPNPPDVTAAVSASVYQSTANGTVWFRPAAAFQVDLTASATDPTSLISFLRFQNLTPTTGWTPSPTLPNQDITTPYTETLNFTASAVSATLEVYSQNGAGLASSTRTLTLTADTSAPTVTFSIPAAGTASQSSDALTVTWTESDGSGAGVATRSLQRQKTAQTGPGACDTANWSIDGSASAASSPLAVASLLVNTCYRWIQTLTDWVGNWLATTSGTGSPRRRARSSATRPPTSASSASTPSSPGTSAVATASRSTSRTATSSSATRS